MTNRQATEWKTTLKMLSSRKHFDACLTVYGTHGKSLPADKVIYSCLINAALESGAPERASAMLDSYQKADLDPKDHVAGYMCLGSSWYRCLLRSWDSARRRFRALCYPIRNGWAVVGAARCRCSPGGAGGVMFRLRVP